MFGLIDVLFTALQCMIVGVPYASPSARRTARAEAEHQFRSYAAIGGDAMSGIDGARCEVLDSSDSFSTHNGSIRDYVLTLFVVTPENRYFLFKSNASGKPYVQELSIERARLVLKGKFRGYVGTA